uniref:Uncharacterized protein n=1 Tax=Poecilia mexicana TaxID=48701 RepID=A0A3B3WZR6_9TELE
KRIFREDHGSTMQRVLVRFISPTTNCFGWSHERRSPLCAKRSWSFSLVENTTDLLQWPICGEPLYRSLSSSPNHICTLILVSSPCFKEKIIFSIRIENNLRLKTLTSVECCALSL